MLTVGEVRETGSSYDYAVGDEVRRTVFVTAAVSGKPVLNHENEAFAFVSPDELENDIEPHLVAINRQAVDCSGAPAEHRDDPK